MPCLILLYAVFALLLLVLNYSISPLINQQRFDLHKKINGAGYSIKGIVFNFTGGILE